MGFLVALIKLGIKWAPKSIVLWVANYKLKGITEVKDYAVDLETRTVYANILLYGESEAIEVKAEQFGIILDLDILLPSSAKIVPVVTTF